MKLSVDTSYHHRRLAARLQDPAFQASYDRASLEISIVDHLMLRLDELRRQANMSKADLARQVGMNPASIRRLFSSEANPTIRTYAAMAAALGAEISIAPKQDASERRLAQV